MTNIEQKALALVKEVAEHDCYEIDDARFSDVCAALCRAIEQHEAFRQEVSDAVVEYFGPKDLDVILAGHLLERFIIPAPKPDPLVEVLDKMLRRRFLDPLPDVLTDEAHWLRAELEARGLEIREKNDD